MQVLESRAAQYYVYYPVALGILALGLYVLASAGKHRRTLGLLVLGSGLLLLVLKTIFLDNPFVDFAFVISGGDFVNHGRDPYTLPQMPFPPTALPLFAVLAALPYQGVKVAWLAASVVATVALIPLARRCLLSRSETSRFDLDGPALWVLTAMFSVSISLHVAIKEGNMSVLVTLCILLAIVLQSRGQGVAAGFCLALATIKPQTLLPFLMLFLRRSDLRTWVTLAVVSLLLCAAGSPIAEIPARFRGEIANVKKLTEFGAVNDYSFEAPVDHNIIGLNRLVYCLGMRDRVAIQWIHVSLNAALGIWLLTLALRPRGFPRDAFLAILSLYSLVFFYHRHYDLAMFAIPLVYCASRVRSSRPLERRLCFASLVIMLAVMDIHPSSVQVVLQKIFTGNGLWERLGEAFVIPYFIWAILAVMVCLTIVARLDSGAPADAASR